MDEVKEKTKVSSRLAFFRRPLRLKGNSSISIPLGVVLLFPCIVVVLILVLFVRHPKSGVGILMPAGAPPAIRYVCSQPAPVTGQADMVSCTGRSAKTMIRSL